jgi:rhodanese-related sulfurtransferase
MSQLFEFIQHHALLVSFAGVLAVAVAVVEFRLMSLGASSIAPSQAVHLINAGACVLDVRSNDQFASGHIIDARNIESSTLANSVDSLKKYREKVVVVCCDSGATASTSARTLKALGFNKVVNLRGGLQAWKQENFPLVTETRNAITKKSGKAA